MAEPESPEHSIPKGLKRQRSPLRKTLSRSMQYVLVRTAVPLISRLPLSWGRKLAGCVGSVAFGVLRREHSIALANLTFVYGDTRSPGEIRATARNVFRHTAVAFVEWLILRRWSREKLERRFPDVCAEISELDERLGGRPLGSVGVTAHFGNWEVLSLLFGHFAPGLLHSLAKRPRFPPIARYLHRLRSTPGASIVYSDGSPRQLMRLLRDGRIIGVLPDQDIRTNAGVFVDFFGRPAYTVCFPMALARKTEATMYTCFLVRQDGGFRLLVDGPHAVKRSEDSEEDVRAATQLWTNLLERAVREHPEQWSWHYPRWRSTPEQVRKYVGRGTRM